MLISGVGTFWNSHIKTDPPRSSEHIISLQGEAGLEFQIPVSGQARRASQQSSGRLLSHFGGESAVDDGERESEYA